MPLHHVAQIQVGLGGYDHILEEKQGKKTKKEKKRKEKREKEEPWSLRPCMALGKETGFDFSQVE
jgi:hypothetical protein